MTVDPLAGLFAATVVIETGIAALVAARGARGRTVMCCVLANCLTWPLVAFLHGIHGVPLVPVEMGVIVVEALAYRWAAGLPWRRGILLAVVANAATWAVSLLY